MHFSTIALSALAAMPFASAVGNASVRNFCSRPLCVYEGSNTYTIQPNANHSFDYPANGMAGAQLRVSPTCDPNNIVFWEIAQGNNIIYYDVNTNAAKDPFIAKGLGVTGSAASCPAISCAGGGSLACFNNPSGHAQNQVKACASSNSIFFNACRP